jgi:hypothetical protein
MQVLLLILYGILCAYAVVKTRFIRRSKIRSSALLFLFGLHVGVGCLHNLIAWYYYPEHGDIWMYFQFSPTERYRLFNDFNLFWKFNSEWDFFSHNAITFIHILLNPLSGNNLYINTLLFSFPVFLGNIALFRVFRHRFPDDPLPAFSIFLLPSVLFWTSCIHREAVLYMLIGFLLYNLHRLLARGFTWKRTAYSVICFLFIIWVRSSVALLLLPAIYCWLLAEKPAIRKLLLLLGAVAAIGLILSTPFQHLPETAARRQHEFLAMDGHSRLPLPALDASWGSLLRILPTAVKNGFFEPLPGSGGRSIYILFSLELLLIWGIIGTSIIHNFRSRKNLNRLTDDPVLTPFGLFCLFFAFAGILLVGIMIPFAGTIVRYRSIFLPFLLCPFLHSLRTVPLFQALNHRLYGYLSHRL